MTESEKTPPLQPSTPDPALGRLERLVGTWKLTGRILSSPEDNITGWTTFEWMPGKFFLKAVGEITFQGARMQSLEIIAYDPERKTFPSSVYSSMSGTVFSYEWDIQGNTVIHSGLGATIPARSARMARGCSEAGDRMRGEQARMATVTTQP